LRTKTDEYHYLRALFILKRDIGIEKEVFSDYEDRIHFFNEFTEIAKNVYLLTELIINALFPRVMDISTQKMKTISPR
jgi:7,8-dihydropterin-6-yl-methyl-4-(beta-D-ribofuranosyl)aminobenzene 5'-phosphate synthase